MSPPRSSPVAWTETSPDRRFRLVAIAAVLALLLGLVGCGGDDGADGSDQVVGGDVGISVAEAKKQEQRVLNQRARAVRDRDLDLFLKRVDRSDRALVARQTRYFRNLVQLPLVRFGYRVTGAEWEGQRMLKRWGDDVHIPQVRMTMQLRDYDAVPVQRTVGFVFAFRKGRAVLVSDQTASGPGALPRHSGAVGPHRDPGARGGRRARDLRPSHGGHGGRCHVGGA